MPLEQKWAWWASFPSPIVLLSPPDGAEWGGGSQEMQAVASKAGEAPPGLLKMLAGFNGARAHLFPQNAFYVSSPT